MTDDRTDSDTDSQQSVTDENDTKRMYWGRHYPLGRPPNSDSIDASSEEGFKTEDEQTDDGHSLPGFESSMATQIGLENEGGPKADRLRKYHEGRHRSDGEHSTRESRRDKRRIPQAICSDLPLARHERDKVLHVVENLDFSRFGYQKELGRVTLGVIAVVIDERIRDPQPEADPDDGGAVRWSEGFREACDSLDVSMGDLSTIQKTVREALDEGDVRIPYGKKLPKRDPLLPDPTSPSERPDAYWEELSPEHWVSIAKRWENRPEAWAERIPDKYRGLIDNLRQWEPWENEDEESVSVNRRQRGAETSSEEQTLGLDESEIEETVEEVLAEIEDETEE